MREDFKISNIYLYENRMRVFVRAKPKGSDQVPGSVDSGGAE